MPAVLGKAVRKGGAELVEVLCALWLNGAKSV